MPKLLVDVSVDAPSGSYWINRRELQPGEAYVVLRDDQGQVTVKIATFADAASLPYSSKLEKNIGTE